MANASAIAKRQPRACERCRQARRRCEPPLPCRSCLTARVPCDVRAKARPQRRQQRERANAALQNSAGRPAKDDAGRVADLEISRNQLTQHTVQREHSDALEILTVLVRDILSERYGYALKCPLVEPQSCRPGNAGRLTSVNPPSTVLSSSSLDSAQVWNLLIAFREFMSWQDAKFVSIEDLHATACTHIEHLSDLSVSEVSVAIAEHLLPIDSIASLFAALSLGAVATAQPSHARFYFSISTEMIKHFVGPPTLELCLAYFLQHNFALGIGTSNYTQGIIAQAIRIAHDLGLHRNTRGIQGLQLYLLIYMADQYCSTTYHTKPVIRASELEDVTFRPLTEAEPQLQSLVDLVMINGYLIEHSDCSAKSSEADILVLESRISNLSSRRTVSNLACAPKAGLRAAHEPLAHIHMLCYRLNLRVPYLKSPSSTFLPSLCICIHSATNVLATYLQLYRPVLIPLTNGSTSSSRTESPALPIANRLGPTWRQVKRIMTSALMVAFAYWHGEMIHEEAARYFAMARLCLEFPRWRWAEKLNEAIATLEGIAGLVGWDLEAGIRGLLPGVGEGLGRTVRGAELVAGNGDATPEGLGSEIPTTSGSWSAALDPILTEDLSGYDVEAIEYQDLFGLWALEP